MDLLLQRDLRDSLCTLGVIESFGRRLQTLERPWVPSSLSPAGTKGVSCVAPGRYKLVPHSTEAHKDSWALVNPMLDVYHWEADVPVARRGVARTTVLIHPANYPSELRGCVAPGLERMKAVPPGGRQKEWQVARSRDAMNQFKNIVSGKIDVWLTITDDGIRT